MCGERKNGIMRAFMDVLREISGTDLPITDIEGFEKLVCAMMDFVSLILFKLWKDKNFKQVSPFSDVLNDFNERILRLAHSDRRTIETLRQEMHEALNAD
jgi:hypothetical protein